MTEINKHYAGKKVELVRGSYKLGLAEHRLLNLLIGKVNGFSDEDSLREYSVTAKEYTDITGTSLDVARVVLKKVAESLFNSEIKLDLPEEDRWERLRWLTYVRVEDATLYVQFSLKVFQGISELKGSAYIKLVHKYSMTLKRSGSIRLYEILLGNKHIHALKKGGRHRYSVQVEDLMDMMDVPDSARVFKVFNKQILKPAVEELEPLADIQIESKKEGRSVVGLVFLVGWRI